jgi:hypothetical protein
MGGAFMESLFQGFSEAGVADAVNASSPSLKPN